MLTVRQTFKRSVEAFKPINTARMLVGKNAYYVKEKYLAPKALACLNAYTRSVTDRAYTGELSNKALQDYTMLKTCSARRRAMGCLWHTMRGELGLTCFTVYQGGIRVHPAR